MSLRVDHRPGLTLADAEYRAWERLFPQDAHSKRILALEAAGLRIDDLQSDVRRSLMLITDVEVLARLFSSQLDECRRVELDALAVVLRLARSLAHRRGRGKEAQSLLMDDLATQLLSSTGIDSHLVTNWNRALDRLSRRELVEWSEADIDVVAGYTPVRMMYDVLAYDRASDFSWGPALRSGSALDWVTRDLTLLFKPGGVSTQHVGPISDLLYEHDRHQLKAQGDRDNRGVIARSAKVMDSYAEELYPYLSLRKQDVPDVIRSHFAPAFNLALRVVSSLSRKDLL